MDDLELLEKTAEAMLEAQTALTLATEDVDYAIADLTSLYEEAIEGEASLSKKTRLEKQRDKKLGAFEERKTKILSKLPTPPDGGGDTPADEDSVNFRNDTDGAAENAEGVRIATVALPTTRDTVNENAEQTSETIPEALRGTSRDPAVMAQPLMSTIVDVLSLIVYFGIASWILF
jgi:hypothetical protein